MQEALAQLVADTTPASASPNDLKVTGQFLQDCLSIGIAGRRATFRDELLQVVSSWGEGRGCSLMGDELRAPATTAAYMNAFQIHCLEFDCVHEAAVAHVMTAPVAAALAECESCPEPTTGARFLTALMVGVEVAAVLGLAAKTALMFFRPATTGVFGAAAAIASLRGYDREQVLQTFGYALSQTAGTMQAHEEGKPTLAIQLAAAARAGLVSADLARSGIPAPVQSIDGKYGYLALFEAENSVQGLCDSLGAPWRIHELSYKPYPSGRATHAGIDLILQLREKGLAVENFDRLLLEAPPLIHQLVIRPALPEMNVNYARLCFPYVGAVALANGAVTIDDFSCEALRNPFTLSVAGRIRAELTDSADPAAFGPQLARAWLKDETVLNAEIDYLPGSPDNPLSDKDRIAKVYACCRDEVAEALIETVGGLIEVSDVRAVIKSLTGSVL